MQLEGDGIGEQRCSGAVAGVAGDVDDIGCAGYTEGVVLNGVRCRRNDVAGWIVRNQDAAKTTGSERSGGAVLGRGSGNRSIGKGRRRCCAGDGSDHERVVRKSEVVSDAYFGGRDELRGRDKRRLPGEDECRFRGVDLADAGLDVLLADVDVPGAIDGDQVGREIGFRSPYATEECECLRCVAGDVMNDSSSCIDASNGAAQAALGTWLSDVEVVRGIKSDGDGNKDKGGRSRALVARIGGAGTLKLRTGGLSARVCRNVTPGINPINDGVCGIGDVPIAFGVDGKTLELTELGVRCDAWNPFGRQEGACAVPDDGGDQTSGRIDLINRSGLICGQVKVPCGIREDGAEVGKVGL